ncbi:MAG: ATP-binding cassette domain-containing protein, partial [Acetatifactor sp.]|nr:ATP-binding cassette domain-containing protein [Acetatifactor sp.]
MFQFYNLVPNLTVQENIQFCGYLTENPLDINELMDTLGLSEHHNKFPSQLPGGQQQRCAIARALIKIPNCCCAENKPNHPSGGSEKPRIIPPAISDAPANCPNFPYFHRIPPV